MMEQNMEHKKYLEEIVAELMADPDWELPPECRFFIAQDVAWGMIFM